MRALEFLGASKAQVIDTPRSTVPPGWALVKVHYCALCGSDLWLYRGKWHGNQYPIVPGHEWAGVVAEVSGADQSWVDVPVVGDLIHACRRCGPCRDGLPVMCEDLTEIGFTVAGGAAGYVAVPVENLYQLPAGFGLLEATQAEPLAVALHAVDRAGLRPTEQVAVLGCGGIGLLTVQGARLAGTTVAVAADPVGYRQDLAVELGAAGAALPSDLAAPPRYSDRYDVVFETSGDPASVALALDLMRPGGRVVLVGYRVGETHPIETAKLPLRYASLLGVMGPGGKFREAVRLLAARKVEARRILTDLVGLDDFAPAMQQALHRVGGTIRVVFDLRHEG